MTRRPLMYVTSSFAAGIIIAYYFDTLVLLCLILGFGVVLFMKKTGGPSFQIIAFGFCFGVLVYSHSAVTGDAPVVFEEQTGEMKAKILQVEERESESGGYAQFKVRVMRWNSMKLNKKEIVLIRYYGTDDSPDQSLPDMMDSLLPGDEIAVRGQLYQPDGRRNPGCFDYALYLRSIGIEMCMTASDLEVVDTAGKDSLMGRLHMLKEKFLERLGKAAGQDTAAVMSGILFGSKNRMDEELLEDFQRNGTAHILAVSGLHVGIIYAFLSTLWVWRKGWVFFCFILAFFCCYMVLAAFSPSVVRAVFMVGLHALAKLTNHRYDISSAAFLTALLMLLHNPMHVFHTGFQMSFLAVLTLSLILPVIKKFYTGLFLASLSVQAGLLPYTIYSFNYLSAAAVFVNVPVVFMTGIIVPAGLLSMAVMELWPPVFDLISGVLFGLCRILTEVNAWTCIDGVTVFTVTSPPLSLIALYYLCLLFFASEDGRLAIMRKGTGYMMRAAVFVTSAALIFGTTAGNSFKDAEVVFVDVGQGDCIHLRTEQGNYLIDGGGSISSDLGKKTLKPYLLKNGVRQADGAFVTHLHTDHYKGIAELCREGMVERLFLYEGNRVKEKQILEETGLSKEDITYLYKGQTVRLSKEAEVQVLWPERETEDRYREMEENAEDENASSLILKANVKGCSILATADVDAACLDDLAEEWDERLEADVLKAAHHGSKYSYSEAFADAAAPQYVVFQVGKNNFGHPNEGVVENYRGKGIIVYRNDEDGAVAFDVMKNGGIRAMTVRGDSR